MLRVAILTIDGYTNYGNRLQNFALQESLRSLGCHVETVRNSPEPLRGWSSDRLADAATRALATPPARMVGSLKSRLTSTEPQAGARGLSDARANAFAEFSGRNIAYSTTFSLNRSSDTATRTALSDAFDAFVVGSDQVWNPHQRHGSANDFLCFAPKEKRTAYAASFGVDVIPRKYRQRYSTRLEEMSNISVREQTGSDIVKSLTGRDVPVVLDPTLLLSRSDWEKLATPAASKPKQPYLLTYFLGTESASRHALTQRIANEHGLTVVSLNTIDDPSGYTAGPPEFVDYISSASYVLTDSFHGAVFSILFRRHFTVLVREGDGPSMGSRLQSLLSRFGLADQMYSQDGDLDKMPDYSVVDAVLDEQRKFAFDFLSASVGATTPRT